MRVRTGLGRTAVVLRMDKEGAAGGQFRGPDFIKREQEKCMICDECGIRRMFIVKKVGKSCILSHAPVIHQNKWEEICL